MRQPSPTMQLFPKFPELLHAIYHGAVPWGKVRGVCPTGDLPHLLLPAMIGREPWLMPELPEVETIVRGRRAGLPGRLIPPGRLGKTDFIDDPAALERELPGSRIDAVERHGKFIAV